MTALRARYLTDVTTFRRSKLLFQEAQTRFRGATRAGLPRQISERPGDSGSFALRAGSAAIPSFPHDTPGGDPASQPGIGDAFARADLLTARQREVVALIALGLTNAQIAERLVVVPGTVANHVQQILTKLDFQNRSQVAVWAVHHTLRARAENLTTRQPSSED